MKQNDLEQNLQQLADAKVVNLEVSLGTLVKGGAMGGLDPWDVFCGTGWIIRRRFPVGPTLDTGAFRSIVREELANLGGLKGG